MIKAVRAFMEALSIEYGHLNESGIKEIEDVELVYRNFLAATPRKGNISVLSAASSGKKWRPIEIDRQNHSYQVET